MFENFLLSLSKEGYGKNTGQFKNSFISEEEFDKQLHFFSEQNHLYSYRSGKKGNNPCDFFKNKFENMSTMIEKHQAPKSSHSARAINNWSLEKNKVLLNKQNSKSSIINSSENAKANHIQETLNHEKEITHFLDRSSNEVYEHSSPNKKSCLPKRVVSVWSGHQGGVNKILWLPKTANLLLSGGLDGKVKLWDVHNDHRCLNTYLGHNESIRDIDFDNSGRAFVTSSFDNRIIIWDTETGKTKRKISCNKLGYALKIHPDDEKQDILLVGCPDRKIYQYDLRTGGIVQEYDRHLDSVNTITFVNQNRWFLTTSDDRTIRVWEFGIPEQIKYIADPNMHSVSNVTKEPKNRWLLMQSMNNTILTYGAGEKIKLNKNKTFYGHKNAGFACQVTVSPDGRYIASGDGSGKCYFWDWKTTSILKSIEAHYGSCMGAIWHPYETSKVATCAWGDALIKFWG
eukprot:gnl/TRDRNA2_/TRDRNA2_177568_c0_seq1.p1 gnl/TRDRNA2_/TRDRNA2_177568_c0~~gnl/TRDRNA2_/TRDRNA2_177568_c0_seq1.p1  ORF type:complete len:457 (+),score=-15.09 gnl/TRDRNA2_/TRDRNA2_177568_c0_seq1:424-1794(+)